uniref:Uncharacterized protein n=1 Tax=Castor canadensis TaxID=51338 RepID=A0A8C0WVL2_CASCN
MQKTCLALYRPNSWLCHHCVAFPLKEFLAHCFGNIISMGNKPLSDFSFPLWNEAKTVDSTKFFFLVQSSFQQVKDVFRHSK